MAFTPQFLKDLPTPESLKIVHTEARPKSMTEIGEKVSRTLRGASAPPTPWPGKRTRVGRYARSPHEWVHPETNTAVYQLPDRTWTFTRPLTIEQQARRAARRTIAAEKRRTTPTRRQLLEQLRRENPEQHIGQSTVSAVLSLAAKNNRRAARGDVARFTIPAENE